MFPISEELGATQCLIRIAEELRNFNHNTIFAGSGKYMSLIKDSGFECIKMLELDQDIYLKFIKKGNLGFHNYKSIESFVTSEVLLINKVKPDLIIDIFRPTIYISSKITNISRIHIANSILTKYYSEKLTIPEGYWAYHITSKSKIIERIAVKSVPVLKDRMYKHSLSAYNKFLKDNNLPEASNFLDLFEGDVTILMDAKEFAPIKNYPENIYQVGPILYNKISKTIPKWINELGVDNKKVIYVSMGSTGNILERILEDLYSLYINDKNIQVVSNVTFLTDKKLFFESPNFFIEQFLPAREIMKKSDLVITHGGRGTIYHALEAGVPIIGIPHQPEQDWNLNRISDLKVGIKIPRFKYNKERLKHEINNIFNNSIYKNNALQFKRILERYNGAKMATEIINKYYEENIKNR